MAAGSEGTAASVLTGVLETSSNYHCAAEFAGGRMTVPKQNIPPKQTLMAKLQWLCNTDGMAEKKDHLD